MAKAMNLRPFMHAAASLALLCAGTFFCSGHARAQMIDFGQIDSFESMGTGTQHGGARPKTIVDDGEWHTVLFTIIDSSTEARIYWRSPEGDQTTVVRGPSVKAFQTAGTFKIEALGNDSQSFKYGYVLFRLKKDSRGTNL
jgi:hypothetical protein